MVNSATISHTRGPLDGASSAVSRAVETVKGPIDCWHCGGADLVCPCLFCDGKKCQACVGRARTAKELDLAARLRLDVQNSTNYEVIHEGPYRFKRLKLPKGVAA